MWKLTIEDDEGKRTPLPLARDEYTVGRGEDNSVRLTERNISRKHALLRRSGNQWLLVDCTSYNGSYVNGVRLVGGEHFLAQGDVVQLGDYRLEFADEDPSARTAGSNVTTLPGGGPAAIKPDRLVVVIGPEPGEEFLIQAGQVSIGRAPELDVCIPHGSVSRMHAEIHALGSGRYEILDRGSANGVRVNGSMLKRGLLEAGDFIELGEVKLKFVGAGQTYRPGPEATRLEVAPAERSAAETMRPPPTSHLVFGTTSSIERRGDAGVRARRARAWILGGCALALLLVGVVFVRSRAPASEMSPSLSTATPVPAQGLAAEAPDPAHLLLEDVRKLVELGDLDSAHRRIAADVGNFPSLGDSAEVRDIESQWADGVLARANQEHDVTARRTLLSSVAQATTVDAGRRRAAADKLKEADTLGTDVRELPKAKAAAAPAAAPSPLAAPADPQPRQPRPILAADPWSTPAPTSQNRAGSVASASEWSTAKATDLALQGRDGEAKARAQLEPRVWSGRASPEEIRMLRAICKHMGDRACIDRTSALLPGPK